DLACPTDGSPTTCPATLPCDASATGLSHNKPPTPTPTCSPQSRGEHRDLAPLAPPRPALRRPPLSHPWPARHRLPRWRLPRLSASPRSRRVKTLLAARPPSRNRRPAAWPAL